MVTSGPFDGTPRLWGGKDGNVIWNPLCERESVVAWFCSLCK